MVDLRQLLAVDAGDGALHDLRAPARGPVHEMSQRSTICSRLSRAGEPM